MITSLLYPIYANYYDSTDKRVEVSFYEKSIGGHYGEVLQTGASGIGMSKLTLTLSTTQIVIGMPNHYFEAGRTYTWRAR